MDVRILILGRHGVYYSTVTYGLWLWLAALLLNESCRSRRVAISVTKLPVILKMAIVAGFNLLGHLLVTNCRRGIRLG
jgi:hypothetical protein